MYVMSSCISITTFIGLAKIGLASFYIVLTTNIDLV